MQYLIHFLRYRCQVKTKLILDVISNDPNHKNHMVLVQKLPKNVLEKCNHGYKNIDMLYLSNGAR